MKSGGIAEIDAIIFDRDGVLIEDCGYPHLEEHMVWMPDALNALAFLKSHNVLALVATNQSGVARGYYSEQTVLDLHVLMNQVVMANGGEIAEFAYCPHLSNATVEQYRMDCNCRKPKPGMLVKLLNKFDLDPSRVRMIGDKQTDMEAAHAIQMRGHLYQGGSLLRFIRSIVRE